MARHIKTLRERDLLVGEVDPADRRNVRLFLTSEGKAVLRSLQQHGPPRGYEGGDGLDGSRTHHAVGAAAAGQA